MHIGQNMTELAMLLRNEWKEDGILITHYEDGYLLSSYMTVVDIDRDSLNTPVICTDAFYNKMPLQFSNITNVK
ncbi:YolD-like family protein [Bacillus cereus]|uniref:YolD-like family protein n=1 Tax=Bacillus cereus TaxID=1396 RepID=UPI00211D6FB2|nr:YolD-like family protein [Bacillus cereus]